MQSKAISPLVPFDLLIEALPLQMPPTLRDREIPRSPAEPYLL